MRNAALQSDLCMGGGLGKGGGFAIRTTKQAVCWA